MEVTIRQLPTLQIIRLRTTGPYQEKAPQGWMQISRWLIARNLQDQMTCMLGYGLDNPRLTPAHLLRYECCFAFDTLPPLDEKERVSGLSEGAFEGGRYAIHTMQGGYHQMPARFMALHDAWLPDSGEYADYLRPFVEIYRNSPGETPEADLLTDLGLPLRNTRGVR